jgi:hypothetical protein
MKTKTYQLQLTPAELETVANALYEKGAELEDDGNEGHPDAAVLYNALKQLRGQQ